MAFCHPVGGEMEFKVSGLPDKEETAGQSLQKTIFRLPTD